MVSSTLSRPNHYEVLGLRHSANAGEIAQAFARKMSLFGTHAPSEAASICAAYETLRSPDKRRDYDRSLGLGRKPQTSHWAFAVRQPYSRGLIGSTSATGPDPEPQVLASPASDAAPETERASAIAESLRRLADPQPVETSVARPTPAQTVLKVEAPAEVDLYRILSDNRTGAGWPDHRGAIPLEWKRPALAVGGLLLGAVMIGGFAGFSVRDDVASATPQLTVPLPAPSKTVAAAPAPVAEPVEMAAEQQAPILRHRGAAPRSRFEQAAERQVADSVAGQAQPLEVAAAEPAADAVADAPVAASMPLPNGVIARTIDRIGYSCGSVASTAAGSSPGAYEVTCSSGQTYQATPVHGRYRFRKAGR